VTTYRQAYMGRLSFHPCSSPFPLCEIESRRYLTPENHMDTGLIAFAFLSIDKFPAPSHPGLHLNPQKRPARVTLTAHNPDLSTVTIPFTVHSVAAARCPCRVFLRGQNPYARTNLTSRPHRTPHSPHQPPAHRLSAHSSLSSHVFPKTFPRRRPPHLRTTTITHATHMTPARRRHRGTGLLITASPHRPAKRNRPSPAQLNAHSALSAHVFPNLDAST
jgi:hypothetical protein